MRVTALNNTLHLSRHFLSLFLILFSSSRLPNCSQLAAARSDTGNANDLPPAPEHPRALLPLLPEQCWGRRELSREKGSRISPPVSGQSPWLGVSSMVALMVTPECGGCC